MLYDHGIAPFVDFGGGGGGDSTLLACSPLFDNASCFPATPAGTVMEIPCMEEYLGVPFNTSGKKLAGSLEFRSFSLARSVRQRERDCGGVRRPFARFFQSLSFGYPSSAGRLFPVVYGNY